MPAESAKSSKAAGAPASALPAAEFAEARATSTAILARREFQAATGPSWWDVQIAKFWSWLGRLFSGMDRLGRLAPWLGSAMEWTLFVGAAVGLLLFARRSLARQRLRVSLAREGALHSGTWEHESEDWARMAEAHGAAREWREAVRCLYWAAIVLLESRRAWRHQPARTPREYVRLLPPGSGRQVALRGLTGIFERSWYGLRDPGAADFAQAQRWYEALNTRDGGEAPGAERGPEVATAAGGV